MSVIIVAVALLAGCATIPSPSSPEVARLQAFADSFQRGWEVRTGWADPGHLGTMIGAPVSGIDRWLNLGGQCVGCPVAYTNPTIYLRDEIVGTRCADLVIASMFARRQERIPFTFAERHVAKETVKLLI